MKWSGKVGVIAAASVVLAGAGQAHAATAWTPISSGTTQEISAIEYRGASEAWLATAGGQILGGDPNGAFTVRGDFPGFSFTDIAFSADGRTGLATTTTGQVYRSTNSGTSWSNVTLPQVRTACTPTSPLTAVPRLNAVFWADGTTAYAVGGASGTEPVILRTTNSGAAFTSINWTGTADGCLVAGPSQPITDGAVVPGNPNALRLITDYFGSIYQSNDGLATRATKTGELINNYTGIPRLALDPSNASRIWAVDRAGGSLAFRGSETGGTSRFQMSITGSPSGIRLSLYDVAFAAGTLVAVGSDGEIYTSTNGTRANLQKAAAPLADTHWRAVATLDAGQALVGGAGGTLVKTTNANAAPDTIPPTGTISGPRDLTLGQVGTFTATLADTGGSGIDPSSLVWSSAGTPGATGNPATFAFSSVGPKTITVTFRDLAGNVGSANFSVFVTTGATTPPPAAPRAPATPGTGGAGATPPNVTGAATTTTTAGTTIATWKKIALSKGRFVPVRISAKSPRRFVIEIRRAAKPRTRVAMARTTMKKGKKLVKVPLRKTVKTGKYLIIVRVYQGNRAIGKRVRTAFVLVR